MKFVYRLISERAYFTRNCPWCQEATKHLQKKQYSQRLVGASPTSWTLASKIIAELGAYKMGQEGWRYVAIQFPRGAKHTSTTSRAISGPNHSARSFMPTVNW